VNQLKEVIGVQGAQWKGGDDEAVPRLKFPNLEKTLSERKPLRKMHARHKTEILVHKIHKI